MCNGWPLQCEVGVDAAALTTNRTSDGSTDRLGEPCIAELQSDST